MAAVTFPERARGDNPDGYLVVQRNLDYIAGQVATIPVDGSELADDSITSAKIVDGSIVNADIAAAAAVEGSKFNWHYGANPPAGPVDGMFWVYQGGGFYWMFIYQNAEPTYKWKFVGGGPLYNTQFVNVNAAHGAGGWTQPYATNPAVVIPRSGDYHVMATCTIYPISGGATWWMGLQIGGTNPTVDQAWSAGAYSPVASARATVVIDAVGQGFTAGQNVAMVYQNNSAQNYAAYNRAISVTPVRVI